MSEVSYSNVPPMMAAIRGGDIETLRSLLHAGHSPNEPQCYQVTIGSAAAGGGNLSAGIGCAGKPDGHGAAADRSWSGFDP